MNVSAPTFFISDLHLDPSRAEVIELFAREAEHRFSDAKALYILGDFFEYWVGDDQPHDGFEPAFAALRQLRANDIPVFFMAGNRDFLVGEVFAAETGVELLGDADLIELYGEKVLLMHGDTLCMDDTEYQSMRAMFRNPEWQAQLLSQPLEARLSQAQALREKSMAATQEKDESITDVNADEVLRVMAEYGVSTLIHGHTHRPAIHDLGEGRRRVVLGDWYHQGSVLRVDQQGFDLESLSF